MAYHVPLHSPAVTPSRMHLMESVGSCTQFLTWCVYHCLGFLRVRGKADLLESLDKDVKDLLQELHVLQGNVAVVNIECRKEACNVFGKVAVRVVNHCAHQPHPLPDHRVDEGVEQLCQQGSPLGHTAAGLEWPAVVALHPTDVRCGVSEVADEAEHLWAYPV
jgi:hypothetical protein